MRSHAVLEVVGDAVGCEGAGLVYEALGGTGDCGFVSTGSGWDAIAIPIAVLSVYETGMRGSLRTV